jgi:hypothetical protein
MNEDHIGFPRREVAMQDVAAEVEQENILDISDLRSRIVFEPLEADTAL